MPRRFAYQQAPPSGGEAVGPSSPPRGDLGPLAVHAVRPGGAPTMLMVDPAAFACRRLVGDLGRAWVRHAAMGAGRHGTVKEWRVSVVEFAGYVDAACPSPETMTVAAITVGLLHGYEDALAGRHPATSDAPAKRAGQLFALLRNIEADRPGSVNEAVLARLGERTAHPNNRRGVPLADFGERERLRLIEAARSTAFHTEQRIRTGRALIASAAGEDHGSPTWPGMVAAAARRELTVAGLRAQLPARWTHLPDGIASLLPATTNGRPRFGELVALAYRHVFPHPVDLMGHYVLLALDTGAPPETLKDLHVNDCHFGEGRVRLRLVKHRAHQIRRRVFSDQERDDPGPGDDDSGVTLSTVRFRDTGSVLRSLIDVTGAARRAGDLTQVFVCGIVHPGWDGVRIGPVPWDETPFRTWIVRNALHEPGTRRRWPRRGGQRSERIEELPALSPPFDLRRLRKSNRSHMATVHPDEFDRWGDNELETFQRHYTRSATVFQVRAGRLFVTIAEELAREASARRVNVITASAADRLGSGDTEIAAQLGVAPTTAVELGRGARDVDGGIAACINPTGGPFTEPGRLCDLSRLGMCLRCPLGVITPRHADALSRFDEEHLEQLRVSMTPPEWAERGLPTRLMLRHILAELGPSTAGRS